jgi:hypothetical protein
MNEHELSNLLHEAAGDATVSSNAPRRVLRKTRLHMAATGVITVSAIVLVAGVGFALAVNSDETGPGILKTASSPFVTAPTAPSIDLPMGDEETLLAEVKESGDQTWILSGTAQISGKLCLNSTTYRNTGASGMGDCVNFGVPEHRHLGFMELDGSDEDRYEVLGTVSTDVRRLDFENDSGELEPVTIIDAVDELGSGRNYFFLWVPRGMQGALEAKDATGEILQREPLCLPARGATETCSVGEESTISASRKTAQGHEGKRLSCSKNERASEPGEMESGMTPREAIQEWLYKKSIHTVRPVDFAVEQIGPRARELSLSLNGNDYVIVAFTIFRPNEWRGEQWKLVEVDYCSDFVTP